MKQRLIFLLLMTLSVQSFAGEADVQINPGQGKRPGTGIAPGTGLLPEVDKNKTIDVVGPGAVSESERITVAVAQAEILEKLKRGFDVQQIVRIDVDNLAREIVDAGILRFSLPGGETVTAFRDSLTRTSVPGYGGWTWQGYIFDGDERVRDIRKRVKVAIGSSVYATIRYQGKEYTIQKVGQSGYHVVSRIISGPNRKRKDGQVRDLQKWNEDFQEEVARLRAREKSQISSQDKE